MFSESCKKYHRKINNLRNFPVIAQNKCFWRHKWAPIAHKGAGESAEMGGRLFNSVISLHYQSVGLKPNWHSCSAQDNGIRHPIRRARLRSGG